MLYSIKMGKKFKRIENALTLQPQRGNGTPRGTFAKFIEGIEEASVVQRREKEVNSVR